MTSAQSYQRSYLRGLLATQGILLDEPIDPTPPVEGMAVEPAVDRDEVLRILVENGAPERDREWLTDSCPSIAAAREYLPPRLLPPRDAWCFTCDGVTACDHRGCIACRSASR